MCRLFGMSGGSRPVKATFWLLEAPDSFAVQSHAEPDGAGLGAFDADGAPIVHRVPIAAYEDRQFAAEARELSSRTFIAHIRYASTGAVSLENTHPFEQDGRLFAHNGVVGDLPALERHLRADLALVHGDTDSERVFALITREIRHGSDPTAAIATAARWVAAELPLYALNVIVTTPDELWALRYPETHDLFLLERPAGGAGGDAAFHGARSHGRIHVHTDELAQRPAVILASERIDDDPGWRNLACGELVHVDAMLHVHSTRAVPELPAKPLTLGDLAPHAAVSQRPPADATT